MIALSLKQEIECWVQALTHYDNNEFDEALKAFEPISDTAKILFNCGVIHATLGQHDRAVEYYQRAVQLDQYFAVAYFQQGVSNFLLGDFEEALANFNDSLLYLRGNTYIDYEQLGLKFKLYSCEVLFNRGLCYIYLRQKQAGLKDLSFAAKEKVTADHDVIDEAIKEEAEGYTVFSIPVGVLYRPNEAKVKNLKSRDYLGKARLIATSSDKSCAESEKQPRLRPATAEDDRPTEKISFAATNLVHPNLQSRPRQHSEPPIHRNIFPPTPPPENDKQSTASTKVQLNSRAASVRRGNGSTPTLLQRAETEPNLMNGVGTSNRSVDSFMAHGRPRLGTIRTASEPRGGHHRKQSKQRDRLFREQLPGEVIDENFESMYETYHTSPRPKRGSGSRPPYIPENAIARDDGYASDLYADSEQEDDYVKPGSPQKYRSHSRHHSHSSRRPDVKKIRVKVHADDTRYIIIAPTMEYTELLDKIRDKFCLKRRFKMKMHDDGDMITIADQDDLELAIYITKKEARKAGSEMGKMEVWIEQMS